MKRLLVALSFLLALAVPAAAQDVTSCLQSLPEGQWSTCGSKTFDSIRVTKSELTNFFGGSPSAWGFGIPGPEAWGGMAYAPNSHCAYFQGGGHNASEDNSTYAFCLRTGWARLTDPGPWSATVPPIRPQSCHTYDGLVWNPTTSEVLMFGSVPWQNSGDCRNWAFNPNTKTWRKIALAGTAGMTGHSKTAITWADTLYLAWDKRSVRVDQATLMTTASNQQQSFSSDGVAAADIVGKRIFYTDGSGFYINRYFKAAPKISIANAPGGSNRPGMAYDSNTNQLVEWLGSTSIFVYDDVTNTFKEITSLSGPGGAPNGVYGKFDYDPEFRVFIGYSNSKEGIWFYRLPGDRAPTPARDLVISADNHN